ncbi:MAG: hypothetical protein IT584_02395 [Chlamydiae bacterium]|nr:hypothetical protein [Chlamydiota bacterium]
MAMQDEKRTFWTFSSQEAASTVQVDLERGLSQSEAEQRIRVYGRNTLKKKKRGSKLCLFFKQFNNPLIFILLFCAVISAVLYDRTDAIIILAIIFARSILSFFQ